MGFAVCSSWLSWLIVRDPLNPLDMEHAKGMWQLNRVYVFVFFNGPWVNPRSKK